MHRVFLIQELLRNILSYVESPAHALSLALTSRALCLPALERIWSQGNAWRLAMSIPKDYRKVEVLRGKYMLSLTSKPRPKDWVGPRFHLYARSIRTLSIDQPPALQFSGRLTHVHPPTTGLARKLVHPSVIRAWIWFGGAPNNRVFPFIQELTIDWSITMGLDLILALVGDSLKAITLRFTNFDGMLDPTKEVDELVRSLGHACPRIEVFGFTLRGPLTTPQHLPLSSSRGWRNLNCIMLEGQAVNMDMLKVCASLPHLLTLRIRIWSRNFRPTPFSLAHLQHIEFGNVVIGSHLSYICRFLAVLDAPRLLSIVLDPGETASSFALADAYVMFTGALSSFPLLRTLLVPPSTDRYSSATEPNRSFEELIRPLFSLCHLRQVSLDIGPVWMDAGASLVGMAEAWPDLEVLELTGPHELSMPWDAFTILLHDCPNLQVLRVPIDVRTSLPPADFVLPSGPNMALQSVQLTAVRGAQGALDAEAIANTLNRLCPQAMCHSVCRDGKVMVPQVYEIETHAQAMRSVSPHQVNS